MKLGWIYEPITTTFEDETKEEWKYCDLYTDVGTFQILMPLDELIKYIWEVQNSEDKLFKFKKLDEYSMVIQHYWELILDLNHTKILWYKEHTIIHDRIKQEELNLNKNIWLDKN